MAHETLPRDARLIALLLAASPSVADAQPAVLTQLLEFAHRVYRAVVLVEMGLKNSLRIHYAGSERRPGLCGTCR